ncbi:glyceraldehyde 3-phosphate dehydrogenase NAD-binding domain-containing protein, partial [Bacteroidota bacterium]
SSSVILNKHSYAVTYIGETLNIRDSRDIAKAILDQNFEHARIDVGRLNYEWTKEKANYKDVNDFVAKKLDGVILREAPYEKPRDVVLFGFGRIGRLLLREFIIQGNGAQLRVRAVVTRTVTPGDIYKRASLLRHDSIHGPFRGNVIEEI